MDLRDGSYAGNGVSSASGPPAARPRQHRARASEPSRVLYRALATVENTSYFTRGVLDENRYLHGSLTFKLDREGRSTITPSCSGRA